jgi:hypothetical protein
MKTYKVTKNAKGFQTEEVQPNILKIVIHKDNKLYNGQVLTVVENLGDYHTLLVSKNVIMQTPTGMFAPDRIEDGNVITWKEVEWLESDNDKWLEATSFKGVER